MITPIIIPIHSRSAPHEPDHKCPKCGHQFDDPDDGATPYILISIMGIIVIAFICLFAWMIDELAFDSRYYVWATTKDDCEFNLPNFEIVPNGNGEFAVKYKPTGEYFCHGKDYVLYTPHISDPTLFVSECNARGFLKEWYNRPFK